jgi:hypothetical protein
MNSTTQTLFLEPSLIASALPYEKYRSHIDDLLRENKTTGTNQSEGMLNYTRMNVQRMNRIDKHWELEQHTIDLLKSVQKPMLWLILTEAWCGDAAQNLPVIQKMAVESQHIQMLMLLRDEHHQLMDQFLTNGTRSIPKLIVVNPNTLEVLASWGPRPEPAHQMVKEMKAKGISHDEYAEAVHKWYAQDKGVTLQAEFRALIPTWQAHL